MVDAIPIFSSSLTHPRNPWNFVPVSHFKYLQMDLVNSWKPSKPLYPKTGTHEDNVSNPVNRFVFRSCCTYPVVYVQNTENKWSCQNVSTQQPQPRETNNCVCPLYLNNLSPLKGQTVYLAIFMKYEGWVCYLAAYIRRNILALFLLILIA